MTRESLGWGWSEKQVDGLARRDLSLSLLLCLLSHVRLLGWYSPESDSYALLPPTPPGVLPLPALHLITP